MRTVPGKDNILPNDVFHKATPSHKIIPNFELDKGAKLTDMVSCGALLYPSQMLVNERLFRLLNEFPGQPFYHQRVKVFDREDKPNPYYFVNRKERMSHLIVDTKKTVFCYYDRATKSYLQFSSLDIPETYRTISCRFAKLALHHEMVDGLHHFVVPYINRLVISQDLAEQIAAEKIKGVKIIEFTEDDDLTQQNYAKLKVFYE